jgi:hypothetical protein
MPPPPENLGLNILIIWEDSCGAVVRSWTQIINDNGALGIAPRTSLLRPSAKFRQSLELTFHSQKRRPLVCLYIIARNMATLLTVDLHPTDGLKIWTGNHISTSLSAWIPIHTDEDDECTVYAQPFHHPTLFLQKHVTPSGHGFHKWAQVMVRTCNGRPYYLEQRELI